MLMTWQEFHKDYIVEIVGRSRADITYTNNTPMMINEQIRYSTIDKAYVLDRNTLKVIKEYHLSLKENDIRSNNDLLRKKIMKDFNIKESIMNYFKENERTA